MNNVKLIIADNVGYHNKMYSGKMYSGDSIIRDLSITFRLYFGDMIFDDVASVANTSIVDGVVTNVLRESYRISEPIRF